MGAQVKNHGIEITEQRYRISKENRVKKKGRGYNVRSSICMRQ
jgi:hypothetical protein